MRILIIGAGAIGSLFGAFLFKNNDVLLIGRKAHIRAINQKGLSITGKSKINVSISAKDSINKTGFQPDLIIICVKSYDTEEAIKEIKPVIKKKTIILSLQNGLDNIDKIKKNVDIKNIIAGTTTHGAIFKRHGVISHSGIGKTVFGELHGKKTKRIENIIDVFNNAGIYSSLTTNIKKELWIKAIINSSINPLTLIFNCKNGYIIENPVLKKIIEKICIESTNVANAFGLYVKIDDMIKKTMNVVSRTADNYSSMLQSYKKGKKTEIDSINGKIVYFGKRAGIDIFLNDILIYLVKLLSEK